MIKNIIIGKNSSITKSICKYLKNFHVFSSNKITDKSFEKQITKYKKINLIFNNFYPSKNLNTLNSNNYKKFCELSLSKMSVVLEKLLHQKLIK